MEHGYRTSHYVLWQELEPNRIIQEILKQEWFLWDAFLFPNEEDSVFTDDLIDLLTNLLYYEEVDRPDNYDVVLQHLWVQDQDGATGEDIFSDMELKYNWAKTKLAAKGELDKSNE